METVNVQKQAIRKTMMSLRNGLVKEEIAYKSSLITGKLLSLPEFKQCGTIMCYVDFRSEVLTHGFIEKCLELGKVVSVPLIVNRSDREKMMVACKIDDLGKDLAAGYFGIEEPIHSKQVNAEKIDMAVIPGVAFDLWKNRIGYGGGFYDRFLPGLRKDCIKTAVAFDVQVINKLPATDTDIKMDLIITESRIIK